MNDHSHRARTHTSGGSRYAPASRGSTANGPRSPLNGSARPRTSKGGFHRLSTAKSTAKVEPEQNETGHSGAVKRRILRKGRSLGKHDVIEVKDEHLRAQSTNLEVPQKPEEEELPLTPPTNSEVTVVAQIEPVPKEMLSLDEGPEDLEEAGEEIPPPELQEPPEPSVKTPLQASEAREEDQNEDSKTESSIQETVIEVPVLKPANSTKVEELKVENLDKKPENHEAKPEDPKKPATKRTQSKKSLKSVKSNKSVKTVDSKTIDKPKETEPNDREAPGPSNAQPNSIEPAPVAMDQVNVGIPQKGRFAGLAKVSYSFESIAYLNLQDSSWLFCEISGSKTSKNYSKTKYENKFETFNTH
ncbi:hypothetical protein L596_024885 [Steinernema carpocapsae]|uniref:Uncharacterized protein n=1 Tax=Steinernema carpocapsae TaxID=34508 RepID=A0A4U5M645_STECR|nr:hypothetical protein L596_024885 [Steinernema carpocapsae]